MSATRDTIHLGPSTYEGFVKDPYAVQMNEGGTGDYNDLTNKPSINDITLIDNKTAEELGIFNPLVLKSEYSESEVKPTPEEIQAAWDANRSVLYIANTSSGERDLYAAFTDLDGDGLVMKRINKKPNISNTLTDDTLNVAIDFVYCAIEYQAGDWVVEPIDDGELDIVKIIDNLRTNDFSENYPYALSAKQGAVLERQITNLKNIGRFLAIWNATTGSPTSEPPITPYVYKVGDYFRIGVAGTKVPTGSTYVPGAYDTVVEETGIGDVWYYDSVRWVKQASSGGGTVQDVQAVGVSLLSGGIANIPASATDTYGLIKESRVDTLADAKITAEAVRFDTTQSLNTSQKEQARINIGAVTQILVSDNL